MQMNLGTSMRTELAQVISPRMIQSMEILQLPVMALQERIEHELQENPVLELREPGAQEEGYPNEPELGEVVEAPETPPEPKAEIPEEELVIDAKSAETDFERMEFTMKDDWKRLHADLKETGWDAVLDSPQSICIHLIPMTADSHQCVPFQPPENDTCPAHTPIRVHHLE